MTIRVMEESRQRKLLAHIQAVNQLEQGERKALADLARQLLDKPVIPIVGAGASYDCGVRLAREIAEELLRDYKANPDYATHDQTLRKDDLAGIAEAIRVKADQIRVVHDLDFPDDRVWRPAEKMKDHFCVYCVLARLAREQFLTETIGFNYDCGAEAALKTEGFDDGKAAQGKRFPDHARVIADARANAELKKDGAYKLYKAHGCAVRYREVAITDEKEAAEGIVVCRSQLDGWSQSAWIRASLQKLAQNHVILLVGFSAQDPKIADEMRAVLMEVYKNLPPDGTPRVVAIDKDPHQTPIESLIKAGLGEVPPRDGAVSKVRTGESTATAAMLVLMTEILALELDEALSSAGVDLPRELDERVAALAVSVPTMVRWSYALRSPAEGEYIQRVNLMSQGGYVPLNENREMTARLMQARAEMRCRMGLPAVESAEEALANDGFLVDSGVAYLPVGIYYDSLVSTWSEGHELEKVRVALPHPRNVECILVSETGTRSRGIALATGEGVEIDWAS
jgi:hypothetical protein